MSTLYVARNPRVAARLLGGELIVILPESSELFSLNETATAIWQGADGRTPLEQIVRERICETFEIDFETAFQDAAQVVRDLAVPGILLASDRPFTEQELAG